MARTRFEYRAAISGGTARTMFSICRSQGWQYWSVMPRRVLFVRFEPPKLRELGLDQNTVVCYTSDHGEMAGAHRSDETVG